MCNETCLEPLASAPTPLLHLSCSTHTIRHICWYFSTGVSISTAETQSHDLVVFQADLPPSIPEQDVGECKLSLQPSL